MAITVASVILRGQQFYPDLTSTIALGFLDDLHQELCARIPLQPDTTETISLTAGTAVYTPATQPLRVFDAQYFTASGVCESIFPTSTEQLDKMDQGWRAQAANTSNVPECYYQQGNVIGFYPVPPVSTSGGYPNITLYLATQPAALGSGDSLPALVYSMDPYLYGMLHRFSLQQHRSDAAMWSEMAEKAQENLRDYTRLRVSIFSGAVANAGPPVND